MMHGRNNGKKLLAVRIIRHAFEIINLLTDQNPIAVLVSAIVNSGPREDSTRILLHTITIITQPPLFPSNHHTFSFPLLPAFPHTKFLTSLHLQLLHDIIKGIGSAGTVRRQAVDVSPMKRVNMSLFLLTSGARTASFRNIKTIAECLADELINAAKGSSNSYAIKKVTFFTSSFSHSSFSHRSASLSLLSFVSSISSPLSVTVSNLNVRRYRPRRSLCSFLSSSLSLSLLTSFSITERWVRTCSQI